MRSSRGRVAVSLAISLAGFTYLAQGARSEPGVARVAAAKERVRITVTTISDAANGDASSVRALTSNPGPDGISLREAIVATNNDRARYEVRFAPALKGGEIRVGSESALALPPLAGGGVSIDGDIDDDGRPDVAVRRGTRLLSTCRLAGDPTAEGEPCAFRIVSSGNKLRSLTVTGFTTGVLFQPSSADNPEHAPLERHRTYARNEISGLVMRDIGDAGIRLLWGSPECPDFGACETHNAWTDTKIEGNTIETRAYGIHLKLTGSVGDRLERLTVTDNTIRIGNSPARERNAIHLEAGLGLGSVRNRISDVLIARNSIHGHQHFGVSLLGGAGAGDANTIQRVRIMDNRIHSAGARFEDRYGINVGLGESSLQIGWNVRPIQYADRNLQRDIEVSGNTLSGSMRVGISAYAGTGGSVRNRIEGLRIENNTVRISGLTGVTIVAGDNDEETTGRDSTGNQVSEVSIDDNTISILRPTRNAESHGPSGGILLLPGQVKARDNGIRDVTVSNNRIDTWNTGIELYGGEWWHRTSDDELTWPRLSLRDDLDHNRLACVVLRDNVIAGTPDELSVIVNATNPDELGPSARDAAWKDCGWDARDFVLASEASGSGGAESPDRDGPLPWLLIGLGSAVALGAASIVWLQIRGRRAG